MQPCPTDGGDADDQRELMINSRVVSAHLSLHEALDCVRCQLRNRRERQSREERNYTTAQQHVPFPYEYFWIDGICINQKDIVERGHQVKVMGKIFSNASCVLVHLRDPACLIGMDVLKEQYIHPPNLFPEDLGGEFLSTFENHASLDVTAFLNPPWLQATWSQLRSSRQKHFIANHQDELYPFMNESYWNRVWIVQEIILAREIKIMCTDQIMDLTAMQGDFARVRGDAAYWTKAWPFWQVMQRKPGWFCITVESASFPTIVDTLYGLQNSECSDPRDRLYSLRGCIDWNFTPEIEPLEPDYTISPGELFEQFVLRLKAVDCLGPEEIWKVRALDWPGADYSILYEGQHQSIC